MKKLMYLLIVLVQVGNNLWVNPKQVTKVFKTGAEIYKTVICTVGNGCDYSEWEYQKVLAVLTSEKGK